MSARKRSLRLNRSRKTRRSLPPLLEDLEPRLVLSAGGVSPVQRLMGPIATDGHGPPIVPPGHPPTTISQIRFSPDYLLKMTPEAGGGFGPDQSAGPVGYTPIQLQTAYGVNQVNFGGIQGTGAGQTIAVIDVGNNTAFQPTGPNFAGSALQVFDKTFGLPDPPSFKMFNQTGGTTLPADNSNWTVEISLDIEWAHSIAPDANLEIVEASSSFGNSLFQAAETAVTKLGASVVSMSFGSDLEYYGLGAMEQTDDQTYFAPALAANPNVTFLASTGDHGADPGDGPNYPAVSPLVVAVGGTTLTLTKTNEWQSEVGWSYGSDGFAPSAAGSGGISNFYPEPAFQEPYQSSGFREIPDVSADADPNTGVAVYDPTDFGASTPWDIIGGTSLSSPMWAGFIAIADQGRALQGLSALDGPTQTLPALYSIPASDYHDILIGFNFYNAGPGYDLVTGRGTPIANKLDPDLANYGTATQAVIAYNPPSSVSAGGFFGTVVQAENAKGDTSFGFTGTAEISLASGPAGFTFTPVTVPVSSGVAVIDGLSLDEVSSTPYVFNIVVKGGQLTFPTLTTSPVTVTPAAPAGTGVYYPLPVDSSLRNDFTAAGSNADPINNLLLVYDASYAISQGQILLRNNTTSNKTIQVLGMGEGKSVITADGTSRDLDIVGFNAQKVNNLTVLLQNLTIAGGNASDTGGLLLPTGSGVGGGILMDGGVVALSNVAMESNMAHGATGGTGFLGASVTGGPGGPGGQGGAGQGGAIYLAAGNLTLTDDVITGNTAKGGKGGEGGTGGLGGTLTPSGFFYFPRRVPGGVGGTGGQGGSGDGGGVFVNGGNLSITSGTVTSNKAVGGTGGLGGFGGTGGTFNFPGGPGGLGGAGGAGNGGGIYLFSGSITLNSVNVSQNHAPGGSGGVGGTGGFGGIEVTSAGGTFTGRGGAGGDGGKGGQGAGGSVYLLNGTLNLTSSAISQSDSSGGTGGVGGPVGVGAKGEGPGTSGPAGSGAGGGIFDAAAALTLSNASITNNKATAGGGIDVKGALTLESSTVSDNSATNGGGIAITGTLVLQDTDVTDNSATADGGGVTSNGNFTISGGTFTGNSALMLGGAIDSSGKGSITGTEFSMNQGQDGGAIYSAKNGTLTIDAGSSFDSNVAQEGGAIESQGILTVTGAAFTGNQVTGGVDLGGAIYNNLGKGSVSNSTFSANMAQNGGAIDSTKGPFTVTSSTFTTNQAAGGGGAIDATGTLSVSGGSFAQNSADKGGALAVVGTLSVSGATITDNSATGPGGGIYGDGNLTVNNAAAITGNTAKSGGGIWNLGNLALSDVTISNNSASKTGGGVYNTSGSVAFTSGTLSGNQAGASGGGIFINEGALTIDNSSVLSNQAGSSGGGIDNVKGLLALNSDTVSQNTAAGIGGGILNGGNMTITIVTLAGNSGSSGGGLYNMTNGSGAVTNATFNLNKSLSGSGGGVFNAGNLLFTNATIAQNSALLGGGVYSSAGTLTAVNATIALNSASAGGHGGGLDIAGGAVALYNTIIASNVRGSASADDIYPLVPGIVSPNSSFNLIGTGAGAVLTNGVNGNIVGVANPHLGALANNGGPVETIALLTGSPAIDAGSNNITGISVPTYDERGAARGPLGLNAGPNVDIGAYEASSSYLVTSTVDAIGYGSIISAVAWANISFNDNPENLVADGGTPAPNTVTFDSANLFSSSQTITLVGGPLVFTGTTTAEAINGTGITNLNISGGGASQIIEVDAGAKVTLSGMTLSGGQAATGGAVDNLGTLDIGGVTFTGDAATSFGGGIRNESQGTVSISNSTFAGDTASQGGAIYNSGTATIASTTLSLNTSGSGGAVENLGTLAVQGSTLSKNSSTGSGGAIDNSAAGDVTVQSSTFANNSAGGGSGQGGAISSAGVLTIADGTFTGNSAGVSGGAVYYNFAATPLSITDSTFTTNTAPSGGAIFTATGTTLNGATFTGNAATSGGAVDVAGSLTATNSTFAANTAALGGALYSNGTITFVNSTVVDNQASTGGGGLDLAGGTGVLYNTLVAQNTVGSAAQNSPSDVAGTLSGSSANDLVGNAFSAGGLTNGSSGNLIGVVPGIASGLANNGGPTETIALLAGSPAIDAGSSSFTGVSVPTIDQRGAERGSLGLNAGSSPDIGAYEASSSYIVSTTDDTLNAGTLRTGIGWANVSTNVNPENHVGPAPNTVFFSATGTIDLTGGTLTLANNGGTSVAKSIQGPGAANLTISGNNTTSIFSVAQGVTASIAGVTITGGRGTVNGGGIDNSGTLSVSGLAVANNAGNFGAGIENEPTGTLNVSTSTFTGNTAAISGGAINNFNKLVLSDDTFTNNSAATGGAVANEANSSITISQSTLTSNSATGSGGGIDNLGTLTVSNSSVVNNTASSGGGFSQETTGTLAITNTTIAFNSGTQGGGVSSAGPITLVNVTVADNNSTGVASDGGGLNLATGGKVGLYNTIVAQNTMGAGAPNRQSDIAVAGGGNLAPNSQYNLIGTGGSGGLSSGGNTSNLVGVANPGLATSLQPSGGITQSLALLPGSPAIDAGASTIVGVNVPIVDQRGALRGPRGLNAGPAADIGAYEASSSYLVSTTADTLDVGTIATAVGWANVNTNVNPANLANPAPNTIVFDQTGLFATPQTITLAGGPLAFTDTTVPAAIVGPDSGSLSISGGSVTIAPGVTASITGVTITGGTASRGGAVDNFGDLTVSNDTLTGNTAATGGAIANESGGTLSVLDSTLSSNTATTTGGAIANDGTATLTNTTIAQNSAPFGGGVTNDGTLTLINDTIAYNTATTSGGGLDADSGTATLFNSILALNTASGSTPSDIENAVSTSSANNVIDDSGSAGGLTAGVNGNQVGVSAGLAASLASNGGPTQTIAILAGSPAIDTGAAVIAGTTVPTSDQRGAQRNPLGLNSGTTIDVGAYEISSSYLVSNTGDSLLAGTLRSAVSWADSNPVATGSGVNTILFDPTVFGTPQTINISDTLGTLSLSNTNAPVSIVGPGASLLTIEGDGGVGLFSVLPNVAITMTGLKLEGGGGQSGGGILNQGSLKLSNSVLANDSAVYYGGGIYNQGGTLTVSNTTFSGDTATHALGGAIDNSGALTVNSSRFTGGVAFEGGAINNLAGGNLTVNYSTLDSNTAIHGGSIYNDSNATITGSTLSNSTAFQGGAIANDLIATLVLLNDTIAGNFAGQNGGGINQVGTMTAYSTTVADNAVAPGGAGGGIDASAGTSLIYNTLVADNTTGTGATATTSDVSGLLAPASSNNLIGGITGLTNGVNGNMVGVNKPLLGTLASNGGPTETIALLAGSPAIDAGAPSFATASGVIAAPTVDQRGALRGPAGLNAGTTVDIGAYEASSSYQVTSSADNSTVGTLRTAIGWADASSNANPANIAKPAANTVVFTATAPTKITLTNGALVLSNSTTPISISGPGANMLSISGNNASQVFSIAQGTTAAISGVTITGGAALSTQTGQSGSGGGVDNFGTLALSNVAISGNSAIDGGGLSNEAGATATLADSTVSGNLGTTGGGISNTGTLSSIDSTIAGNSASNEGGGLANFGNFTAISTTIALNSVTTQHTGGGLDNVGGTVNLYDTIVAANTFGSTGTQNADDIAGTVAPASSFNVIGSAGSGGLTNSNSNLIISDSNAGLAGLQYHGGTTETIALATTSPAIGAGSTVISGVTVPATDQRGGIRTSSTIDVGAYQSGAIIPAIVIKPTITTTASTGSNTTTKSVTPPVVVTTTIATPVATPVTTPVTSAVKTAVKAKAKKVKVKVKVAPKKLHPGAGAATKFHKAAAKKAPNHVTVAKAHPAAHPKKK